MALTIGNVIFYGKVNIDLLNGVTSKFARTGLNVNAINWDQNVEETIIDLEDGVKLKSLGGRDLVVEITVSEVNTTDMADIETADNMTLTFSQPSKTVTISNNNFVASAKVQGGKTVITVFCSVDSGSAASDLFTIS